MNTLLRSALVATTLCTGLAAAQAAVVSLTNITGTWYDANPGANVTSNTGTGPTASIRWGASGYDFVAAGGSVGATVPPSPSPNFTIGNFSHINQPVFSSITDVKLRINADIAVDGNTFLNRAFLFQFNHEETTNNLDPNCPYGVGTGINANGCADRVTVQFLDGSDTFVIGSDAYTVNIIGFLTANGLANEFLTAEQAINTAALMANVTLRSSINVPEPGALALVAAALVGCGLALRRRRD